ncbi:MAG: LysM peptidoglycan-binding domain-containing protein [Tissierellia bacterium]|nr:LysM peptidoglycan-binding domain-containing protein [Tissierellia bacterium]
MFKVKNKGLLGLFLSLVLVLGLIIGPVQNPAFAEEGNVVKLTIVHTNDVHSRVTGNDNDLIGYARLATLVKELREAGNLILLDAGDTTHGLPIATVSNGESIIRLMNQIGYDAMVPGNHDFNYGYERLVELNEMADFPILAANVVKEDETRDLQEYTIIEIDGLKVGIFGLTTQETTYKSNPKNTEGLEFRDPVAVAEEMVVKLEEEGVDLIIALAHIGVDEESHPKATDVAERVEGIDIIVDGHSHTKLDEGKLVGDTLIVQAGEHLKNIGLVDIEFVDGEIAKKEAKLISFEEALELEEDEEISKEIARLEEENQKILSVAIGQSNVELVGEREVVRAGESNLGNLATDAMLDITGADVAMTNGGGIRASIPAGEITKGNVLEVFPFGNYIVVLELTGEEILNALEHGVDTYPELAGKFPHVAGMTYKIDPSKEAGNRIVELLVDGEPIELDKSYTLATNDFMAVGGDGYTMFEDAPIVGEFEGLDEALIKYIEKIGVVEYEVEGRITAIEEVPAEEVVEETEEVGVADTYIVKVGDVLWKIAEKYGLTWERLAEFNKLQNPHLIFPNQKILIPAQ